MSFDELALASPVKESERLISVAMSLLNLVPHEFDQLRQMLVTRFERQWLHIAFGVAKLLVLILHDSVEPRR